MNRDLHNDIQPTIAFATAVINTDTTTAGAIIDTKEFYSLEFVLVSGTLTAGTFTPVVEDGEDAALSDAAVVNTDFLLGTIADATFAPTDDDVVKRIGYVGHKRYVRLSLTSTGTANGTMTAVAVVGDPRSAPTLP